MKLALIAAFAVSTAALTYAQDPKPTESSAPQQKEKPRVFITDSQSWQISGGFGGNQNGASGSTSGGARPQTAEIIKTFGERCPDVTVTMKKDKADYVVILEHEGGKGWALKDNKFALFNKDGDAIKSGSTRALGNAVKDACSAVRKDWESNSAGRDQSSLRQSATESPSASPQPSTQTAPAGDLAMVAIKSSPDGADITIDGKFVGTTPSSLQLRTGEHTIAIEKSGFKKWQRTITVTAGGAINLEAALDRVP